MLSSMQESAIIGKHSAPVRALCVTSASLYSTGDDLNLREFQLQLGVGEDNEVETKYEDDAHMGGISSMCSYGNYLFTGSTDSNIKVWRRDTWECLGILEGHTEKITGLVAMECLPELPDPYLTVVSASLDASVRIWHIRSMRCMWVHQLPAPVNCIAACGSKVVCGCGNGYLCCVDAELLDPDHSGIVQTYEYDGLWEVLGAPVCIAATERGLDEGGVTVAGDSAGFLCAWGTATGRYLGCVKLDAGSPLEPKVMTAMDAQTVAIGCASGGVYLWKCDGIGHSRKALSCIAQLSSAISAIVVWQVTDAMGYHESKLAVGCEDGTVNRVLTSRPHSNLVDKYELYDVGVVGDISPVVDLILEVFSEEFEQDPVAMRQDFCGTCKLGAEWVQMGGEMDATCIDADADILAWARRKHHQWLKEDLSELMTRGLSLHDARRAAREEPDEEEEGTLCLVQLDLYETCKVPKSCKNMDVVAALNYSWMQFHDKSSLTGYLAGALAALRPSGILVLDLIGGPGTQVASKEEVGVAFCRRQDDSRLLRVVTEWDQVAFDDVSRRLLCHVHFGFGDGSELREAYASDLMLWQLDEILGLLSEVGFSRTRVFMETVDKDGDFTGEFEEQPYPVYQDNGPNWYQAMLFACKENS